MLLNIFFFWKDLQLTGKPVPLHRVFIVLDLRLIKKIGCLG